MGDKKRNLTWEPVPGKEGAYRLFVDGKPFDVVANIIKMFEQGEIKK